MGVGWAPPPPPPGPAPRSPPAPAGTRAPAPAGCYWSARSGSLRIFALNFNLLTRFFLSKTLFLNSESTLKVLNNEKRGGLEVVSLERSPFKVFSLRISNKSVRGLQLLSELCFCHLKSIIVCKQPHSVGLRHTFHIIHLIETTVLSILPDI